MLQELLDQKHRNERYFISFHFFVFTVAKNLTCIPRSSEDKATVIYK